MVIQMTIDWVFLDVGGIIFSDDSYFTGLFEAIARVEPATTRDAFVPDPARHAGIRADADASWADRGHHADELYPEALETLRVLAGRYRIGCITNHFSWVRGRAEEAGFADLVGAWAISAEVGAE